MSIVSKVFGYFKKGTNSVGHKHYSDCIIFDPFGNMLLLQRATTDDFMPDKWCLPGGKIEKDESPEKAAERELNEETGLICDMSLLDVIEKDHCTINYFIGFLNDNSQILFLDNDEHYHYQFVPINEIEEYDLLLDLQDTLKDF